MNHLALALLLSLTLALASQGQDDPLASWNDTATRKALIDFVRRTTAKDSKDFVAPAERIAVFDNDGTLWCEQPIYVQLAFALDRVKSQAEKHPEWKTTEPFKSVLAGDHKGLAGAGEKGLVKIMLATHGGITTNDFEQIVRDWLKTARHPKFKRPYTELVYQPMLELLAYLRANGYKTYIVSGGGVEFMRPWVEQAYGIPPEQVVGSSGVLKYEVREGQPELIKEPKILLVDDGPGKPVGIQTFIGRRPIAAFGNSDGDFQMLEWTTAGKGARFGLLVHHDDVEREYAYDRKSLIGKLDRGLNEAEQRGWIVVSIKEDWKSIFAATER